MSAEVLRRAADKLDGHVRLILVDRHREVQGPSGRVVREALAAWLRTAADAAPIDDSPGPSSARRCPHDLAPVRLRQMIYAAGAVLIAAVPHAEPQPEQPADDWCPRCRIHRVRQDAYTGAPSYVALCPVCADEDRVETCDVCPEPVDKDARCTHGRSLCPECLTRCPECRDELADAAADGWRLM